MVPMASGRLRHCLLLLLAALLLLLGAFQAAAAGDVKKVTVALYYESLCPFSARFVVDRLSKFFEDGLVEAADLKLVPYGNAELDKNGTISCQHGPDECLLNAAEACAIDVWPDSKVHFSFVSCVEGLVRNDRYPEWPSCFTKLGLDPKPFADCFESERAYKLSLKFGKETDALVPPHQYVPWVLVDGKPLYDDYANFEVYVCNAYKGGRPPKACQGLVHGHPTVQGGSGGVSYKSGDDLKLRASDRDGVQDKVKMVLPADDDN